MGLRVVGEAPKLFLIKASSSLKGLRESDRGNSVLLLG